MSDFRFTELLNDAGGTLLAMRVVCLVFWLIVAGALLPALVRSFRDSPRQCDDYRVAFFFTALVMIGSYAMRIAAAPDASVFIALNAITAALAVYVLILVRQGRIE